MTVRKPDIEFQRLPASTYQAVKVLLWCGFDGGQIARRLGISMGYVSTLKSRMRKAGEL